MIDYRRITLPNGLTVLLHQDRSTPLVALNILFNAGSKFDPPSKTGLAHLFEHLMFSGTTSVPNFDEPMQMAGGENNAFTNSDYTSYYCYGPASNLETFIWLEADRIENLRLREQEFKVQQKVVIEELHESCWSVPYGDVWHHILPMVYGQFPYAWPTIGRSENELEMITLDDAKAFYEKHYRVSNAILSIVGHIDISKTIDYVNKYFGKLNGSVNAPREFKFRQDQIPARRLSMHGDVPLESFYFIFPMPGRHSKEYYALDLISDLLAVGKSSLLYQTFIKSNQYLSSVDAYITGNIETGLFIVEGKISAAADLSFVEEAFWQLIHTLGKEGLSDDLMQKLKNTSESNITFSEIGTLNKAMNLGYFELVGDVDLINNEGEIYQGIEAKFLVNVLRKYICKDNMYSLHYMPKAIASKEGQ